MTADQFVWMRRRLAGQPDPVHPLEGWVRVGCLAVVCVVAVAITLLVTQGPSDVRIAGASDGQSFDEWYAQPENAAWYEFQQWYGASPRNAGYYHVREHFGTGRLGDQAVRVVACESDFQPRATSPTNDHGLFQLNAPSWRYRFEQVTGEPWNPDVYHADANARFARWLYEQSGWRPWTCRGAA